MTTTESEPIKIVQEHITGDIEVVDNTQFNSIDADTIVVERGIRTRLFGNVKVLILQENSKVFLHGKCSGEVINRGGRLYIY